MQRFVRWLDQCNTTHKLCSSKTNKSHTPARFLNVKYSSYDHLDSVRLVDTNPEKAYRYIVLSHRWDEQTEKVCTTTSTIEQYKTRIRLYILPDQFQEAIRITRTIGIEYIWIDSLCIIQKEPDLADWNIESTKMAGVYQGAYLTIAIAWGTKDHEIEVDRCFALKNGGTKMPCLLEHGTAASLR